MWKIRERFQKNNRDNWQLKVNWVELVPVTKKFNNQTLQQMLQCSDNTVTNFLYSLHYQQKN